MSAPALEKGLQIIEYIMEHGSAGFNDLREELDVANTSLARYLKILVGQGFLHKNVDGKYNIGYKLLNSMWAQKSEYHILKSIMPSFLEKVSKKTGCSSICIYFDESKMIGLDKHVVPEGLTMQPLGQIRTDYILQPWGYLLLYEMDLELKKVLVNNNMGAIRSNERYHRPDKQEIESYFAQIKQEGYMDDLGKIFNQIRRVAYPIRYGQKLVGAIAVVGLKDQVAYVLEDAKEALKEASTSIAEFMSAEVDRRVYSEGEYENDRNEYHEE